MSSERRKQDGEAVAVFVHISTKRRRKKITVLKKSRVITKEFFLVEKDGKRTQVGHQEWWTRRRTATVKVLQNFGPQKSKKESTWKDVTKVFHEAGPAHQRKGSVVAQELQGKPEKRGRSDDTDGRIKVPKQGGQDEQGRLLADSLQVLKKNQRRLCNCGGTEKAPRGRSLEYVRTAPGILGACRRGTLSP